LVPFKKIGDAFAAVCASGKAERGLEGIEIGWVNGKEPPILVWLKKIGKLGGSAPTPTPTPAENETDNGTGRYEKAGLPQTQTSSQPSLFSSFPMSFVGSVYFDTTFRP